MAGRILGAIRQGFATLLLVALTSSAFAALSDNASDSTKETNATHAARSLRLKGLQPMVLAEAGLAGDVFPAFANHLSAQAPKEREFGVVQVKVSNPASAEEPLRARVSVRIPGWSEEELQNVDLPPGMSKTLKFAPPLNDRAFKNREIVPSLAQVSVLSSENKLLYADSVALNMRASDDMYWGASFSNAPMIASWVTPHDAVVEKLLTAAKQLMPGRRLPGYEHWKDATAQEESTRAQARAIYMAVRRQGLSYVKSSNTFGSATNASVSQRIRTPRESLSAASANCIDGAVMFASMFENLGMAPQIVVVPGHAYVGVRVAETSERYLLIDTASVALLPFERAVAVAEHGIAQWKTSEITRVSVADARQRGIYPMPLR